MNNLSQEDAGARLAEAQAFLKELQEERQDATAEVIREAQREVQRCQMAYYVAMAEDEPDDPYQDHWLTMMADEWRHENEGYSNGGPSSN